MIVTEIQMKDADTCPPTETGSQRCAGDSIEVCDGTNWDLVQDCTGAGEICVSPGAGIAMCEAAP
jgi:hypothetical protein